MKLNDKLKKNMMYVVGAFILFIAIIGLISSCSGRRTYTIDEINELELKLIDLARDHFRDNESALPTEGNTVTLSIQALVDAGRIRPLSQILENGDRCSGQITVLNNRGYILYLPKIDCGELYQTQRLTDVLTESVVTVGSGLYAMNNAFVFRGESVNNHIYFANSLWLILRVNTDGTIKIMETRQRDSSAWDNRFNPEQNNNSGVNDFINNIQINSRVRDRLERIYESENTFNNNDRAHIVYQTLCIGKRSINDAGNDGAIECAQQLSNQTLGMLPVYQYLQASLDEGCIYTMSPSCINFNYLASLSPSFWSITSDADSSFRSFIIGGTARLINSSTTSPVRVTALLSSEVLLSSGDGSQDNPFRLITNPVTQ